MKFERMMEMNLANHGFGMEEKVSEVDALVFADDQILVDRYNDKTRRKDRIRNTDLHARRLASCAVDNNNRYVEISTHVGRDGVFKGHKVKIHENYDKARYFVGDPKKAWSKKVRRERFEEPIVETPRVCGVTLAEDEDGIHSWLMAVHHEADWWTHHENTIGFTTDLNEIWDKEVETRYNELHHLKMRVRAEIFRLEREIESAKEKISQYAEDIKCINDQIADLWIV